MATFKIEGPASSSSPNTANGVALANVAVDSLWGIKQAVDSSTSALLPFWGMNHFNTGLLADFEWTIGYLDETVIPYSTVLNTITCAQIQANFKYLPAGQSILDWTIPPRLEGYYTGDPSTHIFTLNRIAAVTNGTNVYLIKVTDQGVIPYVPPGTVPPIPTHFSSEIEGDYEVLSCAVPRLASSSSSASVKADDAATAKLPFIEKLIANAKAKK